LEFDDNRLLPLLVGVHNANLMRIEYRLDVKIALVGNRLVILGVEEDVGTACDALRRLWSQLKSRRDMAPVDVDSAVTEALAAPAPVAPDEPQRATVAGPVVQTRKKTIKPRTAMQARYIERLQTDRLVFGVGPAGTGKTYLAVAQAVAMYAAGAVERIVLSRPAVEAGERLGFLPGDMREKVDPYLRPLYDALYDTMPSDQVNKRLESGQFEIAPLAFMRGRTLANAFVILDEAQNTTTMQMKMVLTRLGEGSRMVVTGDLTQIDLPSGVPSGLRQAAGVLQNVNGVALVHFGASDVVRDQLVVKIVQAYEDHDAANKPASP
jgi:phosphate starvation-inducible PhoH-like protein